MKFLPHSIYESLPYVYIVAGIIAMVKISGQLAVMSGLLLSAVGLLVFKLRMNYRSATSAPAGRRRY